MNWTLFFLIILIISLYSFRRFKRWGKSIASNIDYNNNTIRLPKTNINIRILQLSKIESNNEINSERINSKDISNEGENIKGKQDKKTILVLPPYFFSPRRFSFFLTALAELNYNVVSIKTRSILKIISKNKKTWSDLLNIFGPDIIVCFDMASILVLNTEYTKNSIKKIMIRPIYNKKHLNPFRFIPLTYRWFYLMLLMVKGARTHILNIIDHNESKSDITVQLKKDLFVIIPRFNLQKKSELVELRKNNFVKVIEGGGFSFYKYETIVFGLVSAFIDEYL